ncbi:gdsl esterase/lipase, partial [Quercus suber]
MILPKNETGRVPAVFVFGDSIVDTGTNKYINNILKCNLNFPRYGICLNIFKSVKDVQELNKENEGKNENVFESTEDNGARRIGVTSIPPLSTWVFADSKNTGRRLTKKLKPASVNQAAILFNSRLSSQMVNLNKNLPATKL